LVAIGGIAVPSASAQTLYFSGFEAPTYTNNTPLVSSGVYPGPGQDGWYRFDEDTTANPNDNANVASLTIQSTVVKSGTQALKFQNLVQSPLSPNPEKSSGAYRTMPSRDPTKNLVTISWDINVTSSTTPTLTWALAAYDDGLTTNGPFIIAGAGGYFPGDGNNKISMTAPDPTPTDQDGATYIDTPTGVTSNAWHHYVMTMDFTAGANGVYRLDVDNIVRGFSSFGLKNDGNFGEIDLIANTRGLDTAYFDNVLVTNTSGIIPEPALGGVLLGGAVFFLRRRRVTCR